MGIDYVIDWKCEPKAALSTPGILTRLKARDRADAIIKLYRDNGDMRSPSEMGFELVRRTPDGEEETQIVIVQSLLDETEPLDGLAHYCEGCPANAARKPFGCYGSVAYPLSRAAELWLLEQLPETDEVLPWLLLKQTLHDSPGLGSDAAPARDDSNIIFETGDVFARRLGEIALTTNQVFEMLFLIGSILPTYGAMLMLFFGVIDRNLEANAIQNLTPAPDDWQTRFPFMMLAHDDDDDTRSAFKRFFGYIYIAYGLNVSLSIDA